MPRSLNPKSRPLHPWIGTVSILLSSSTLLTPTALAQSITAALDGTNTTIAIDGHTHHIRGGTPAGTNLFHSFQDFGLSTGEVANFLSNPGIINILGRVTGGNPSMIDGLIQVSGANSNLYLMNPAGIVFGANARLNVGGDFTATTADRIGFEDSWFNATGANDYAALVGKPNQFAFLRENPSAIINQGHLHSAQDIRLVGGAIANHGDIISTDGSITLAAIPGERLVNLAQPGMLLSLAVPEPTATAGMSAMDLPTALTGSGDVVVEGVVQGQQIDLYAAGTVTPSEPSLIQGDARVIRFSATGENPNQAVFIDRRADDPETLLYGAAPSTIAQIIENHENGIKVVTEQLVEFSDSVGELESVAIVAEGNGGNFWLGNQWIQHENIANYQTQLQTWGQALSTHADLLLYSCFTALGATGEALIASLADMTGLDVAASVDLTGSANYGGDWDLEASTGRIEAANPFTTDAIAQWDGKLATLTVDSATDDGVGFTLRDALNAANNDSTVEGQTGSGTDTILFDTRLGGEFALAQTITTASGAFNITDDVIITGTGQAQLTIDGNQDNRVFNSTAAHATFNDLTIANGKATGDGGGIASTGNLTLNHVTLNNNSASGDGGGVHSDSGAIAIGNSAITNNQTGDDGGGVHSDSGTITITDSQLANNSAHDDGGGVHSFQGTIILDQSEVFDNSVGGDGGGVSMKEGAITITNTMVFSNSADGGFGGGISVLEGGATVLHSTVSGNSARDNGGGIRVFQGTSTTITNSTFSGNTAGGYGGGIRANMGDKFITNVTVSGNSASRGGGISLGSNSGTGIATIANTTVSGNSASNDGGAIASQLNEIQLLNTTIAFNSAGNQGGGLSLDRHNHRITNTIIAKNQGLTPDISADLSDSTVEFSLIQNTVGITGTTLTNGVNGNIIGRDPLLMPLADNGGSTQTHALAANSPARNAGNNSAVTSATDQRGVTRILGGTVDIGAVESVVPSPPPIPTPTPTPIPIDPGVVNPSSPPNPLTSLLSLAGLEDETEISAAVMRDRVDELLVSNQLCDAIETSDRYHTQKFKQRGSSLSPDGSLSCLEMQRSLPADAMLVSVVANQSRLSLITLTAQGELVGYQLPVSRDAILAELSQLQAQLTNPVLRRSNQFLGPSQTLHQWLVEPLLPELRQRGISHILFSLDEGIRTLPIAALHDGEQFLIENYSVNLIPSLSLTPSRTPDLQDASVLAMGISQFENASALPAVPIEMASIQTHFPKSINLEEEQATLATFKKQLQTGQHRIVHLATHGHFQPGVTDRSYIQFWDDRLNLGQVEEANWSDAAIDLLVLSACKTALGDAETEYGFAGLAVQAHAGAAVAGLWNAHDAATSALMGEFYHQLSLGQPKGEALRQAQLALLRGAVRLENKQLVGSGKTVQLPNELQVLGDRVFWHPYYWSGFTLIGNPW